MIESIRLNNIFKKENPVLTCMRCGNRIPRLCR